MDKYAALLQKTVTAITHVFKKRGQQKLLSDRSALIVPKDKQIQNLDSFELITWLIVR